MTNHTPIDRILIRLPADRRQPGLLLAQDAAGNTLFACKCLGRSAGDAANVLRDPLKHRGDTPLGLYATTFATALAKPVTGIGALWIGLDPVDGEALKAEQAGRRGLGIHGGRGDAVLKPTHGCIRLFDKDMAELARVAGKSRFRVKIEELPVPAALSGMERTRRDISLKTKKGSNS